MEIRPVTAAGAAVTGVKRDVDGDGTDDTFYPGSRAILVTIPDTAADEKYVMTVSTPEQTLFVDQQTGGGDLTFRASFTLPERRTEMLLEIGSTATGFEKTAVTLFYAPTAPSASGGSSGGSGGGAISIPAPPADPQPQQGYASCGKDGDCLMRAFTDLDPAAWYHDGVHYALENGIMNGVDGGKFDPSGSASRGMIVTMLWRLEGMPEANPASFRDVSSGAWYAKAVSWAAAEHIVDGYGGAMFGPDDDITREQLAAILCRHAKFKGTDSTGAESVSLGEFVDAERISPWAQDAMQWALDAGLISGTGNERLSPKADASRAQVATMLMRYSQRA